MMNAADEKVLGDLADVEIDALLSAGSSTMIKRPSDEVGFVAAVALDGVHAIAGAWAPSLLRLGLSFHIRSVFCHAAPEVAFNNGTRCELADLLFVFDDRRSNRLLRRASLIQAKMANAAGTVKLTGPSTAKQVTLYQGWPAFRFVESKYGGAKYQLATSTPRKDYGTIGVIDRHFRGTSITPPAIWTQHSCQPLPTKTKGASKLGSYLSQIAGGNDPATGPDASPSTLSAWSKVVHKLLVHAFHSDFLHRKSFGSTRMLKGAVALCLSAPDNLLFPQSSIWMAGQSDLSGWSAPPELPRALMEYPQRGLGVIQVTARQLGEVVDDRPPRLIGD